MYLTAKNFQLRKENINIYNPQGNTTNYTNGMGYHRKSEIQRGREDAVHYEKGG